MLKCLLSTKLLLVFNQIFYHIINTGTCIFTIDIILHIAPGLKGHDSRHLVVPLTHSSCQFACKKLLFKNSGPPDPPLPPEKDDHQFFYFYVALTTEVATLRGRLITSIQ